MKAKVVFAMLGFALFQLSAVADWTVLKNEQAQVVEVVVDFRIDELAIAPDGTASILARARVDAAEVGFGARISKPEPRDLNVLFEDEARRVLQSNIEIRSIGPATKNLERLLNDCLSAEIREHEQLRVAAPYHGVVPDLACSVSQVAVFRAVDVGMAFDDSGGTFSSVCFCVTLIVDGPMRRLTAYFSVPGGYGGVASGERVRTAWLEAKAREGANQPPQPNAGNRPSSGDSPASETPSSLGPRG